MTTLDSYPEGLYSFVAFSLHERGLKVRQLVLRIFQLYHVLCIVLGGIMVA